MTPTAPSILVDSSVFFAAAYSINGSAHDLFLAALQGRITLVLSDYILIETERNLSENAPQALPAFHRFRLALPYKRSTPSPELINDAARVVVVKDAPIIAAASAASVHLVATYDRKDLLSRRQAIFEAFGITVAPPKEILDLLQLP